MDVFVLVSYVRLRGPLDPVILDENVYYSTREGAEKAKMKRSERVIIRKLSLGEVRE